MPKSSAGTLPSANGSMCRASCGAIPPQRVLTLENVYAIKITDYDAITAAGIDRGQVAKVLIDTYLKQIIEDGFFHADPHPGNLFVTPIPATEEKKASWKLTFVDFGMVGTVPEHLSDGLRELLIGVGTRNACKGRSILSNTGCPSPQCGLEIARTGGIATV